MKFFELSIAWKYLIPKRKQLSVSLISLISIIVIALVVWLILVFFSITQGLEKGWIEKLISVTAPVRITPTEAYYNSYYYQIDALSHKTDYAYRSIGEKWEGVDADPYDPEEDEELPTGFPKPDVAADGKLKNLVGEVFHSIENIPQVKAKDFEIAAAHVHLHLIRGMAQNFLSQPVYMGTFEPNQASFAKTILNPSEVELQNASKYKINAFNPEKLQPLAFDSRLGYPILAPKSYREAGVLIGDKGFLSYSLPTISGINEQRLPIFVSGFYDPGIVPLGGKFLWADPTLVRTIRSAQEQEGSIHTNGIHVNFDDPNRAAHIKEILVKELEKKGVSPYWRIETFREFDYSKELLQQLRSEKHIFSLISGVIMLVACSNIISMLIILVNNKKLEIGILRSMGASSASIASIFGLCGIAMGLIGSFLGMLLAFFTLRHLHSILNFISRVQGYDAFNPIFYGEQLPNAMNYQVLLLVVFVTVLLSLIAGLVPALKASRMHPSAILRAE